MGVLNSKRLVIREATISDAGFILELMNEPPWRQFIADHTVTSEVKAQQYIRQRLLSMYRQQGFGLWIVELKKVHTPIGLCGLIKRDWLAHIDLGFAFLQRYWGKGYAREASEACLKYAHKKLNVATLAAITSPNNIRSIEVLKSIGFQFVSTCAHPESEEDIALYETLLRK